MKNETTRIEELKEIIDSFKKDLSEADKNDKNYYLVEIAINNSIAFWESELEALESTNN